MRQENGPALRPGPLHSGRGGILMILKVYVKIVDGINEWIGRTVMWLFVVLTATVLIDQFKRYLTGQSTDWAFDINYMVYAVNFMLAGAFCMKNEAHVRVDAIYNLMPIRVKSLLEVLFYLLLLFPMTIFNLDATWTDFLRAVSNKEIGIVSPWHPPIYHFKFVMPLAFFLLLIQEIAQFIRYSYGLIKGVPYDTK
jgi:TRAP-type mannitol/chloroaromatic compound transport system permease small subunit